jgi:glutamine synthetase
MKSKLEYIWLDGSEPTQGLRSKTKIVSDFSGKLEDCPVMEFRWFINSTGKWRCFRPYYLKPVALFPDPARKNGWLVMTEVLNGRWYSTFNKWSCTY